MGNFGEHKRVEIPPNPMAMQSSSARTATVAESILRFQQISAGRCIVGLGLSFALVVLGSGTLLTQQRDALLSDVSRHVTRMTNGH
jgi:hypothetical protein